MNGLIYNSFKSRTKIRELIEYLNNNKFESDLSLIRLESFYKLMLKCFTTKAGFVHVFNPVKIEVRILKLINIFFKRKLIFSFEDEKDYEKVSSVLKNDIILVESKEAMNYFKNKLKHSMEVFLVRPYTDSAVYVASGAKQLSIKKEILFLYDSSKNSKAHLIIEMMKYLPPEVFLTCVDDVDDKEDQAHLKDIANNLKVDPRVKIENYLTYDFEKNISDLSLVMYSDKEESRFDFSCTALSQGLVVVSNTPFDQEQINGWYRFESVAPKALAKRIMDLCDQYIEVDSKTALSFISKEAKAKKLLDFYTKL